MKNSTDNEQPSEIDCKSLEKFVVEFLDDQLPIHTKAAFLNHIKECVHCDDYLKNYKKTIAISKAAKYENVSTDITEFPEELVEAILTASKNNR